eukprot:GHVL01027938.1.p1 GENE.GHVL01027938.1~~GHVL01027938.1.p1  ORF type:complete len:140 (+),score=22.90 GHVL01027938.1:3-422(+)
MHQTTAQEGNAMQRDDQTTAQEGNEYTNHEYGRNQVLSCHEIDSSIFSSDSNSSHNSPHIPNMNNSITSLDIDRFIDTSPIAEALPQDIPSAVFPAVAYGGSAGFVHIFFPFKSDLEGPISKHMLIEDNRGKSKKIKKK